MRNNKRGCIVERHGNYSIKLSLGKGPDGKYKYQWVSLGKVSMTEAKKRLTELLHQLDTGSYLQPGKTTLAEYLTKWLSEYAKPNLSPRSFERYESIVRVHLTPDLGSVQLTQLKLEHIQKHCSSMLAKGLSARSIRYHHVVLHKALQTAIKWGLTNRNVTDGECRKSVFLCLVSPFLGEIKTDLRSILFINPYFSKTDGPFSAVSDGVDIPKAKRNEMQTWSEAEVNHFLDSAKDSQYYPLFYTALYTGMRRSELLALRWQDIDLLLGQISVNRSLHQLKDTSFVFTQPKSAKGSRTIALSPSAILTLKGAWEKQASERLMLDTPVNNSDLVFSTYDGKPLRPNTVSRAWQNLAIRAGVKIIRFHDARHTHASILLKQGIHPKIVQERLGHASIQITLDTYSHVAPGLQQAAANRFDEALNPQYNKAVTEKGLVAN